MSNNPTNAAVDAEIARREMVQRMHEVVANGRKQFSDFDEKSNRVAALGAIDRPEFFAVITGMPDAHEVIANLADDPDDAMRILALPPIRLAAELGRKAAKPKPAPLPAPKPSLDDPKLSMAQFAQLRGAPKPKPAETPADKIDTADPKISMADFVRGRAAQRRK